MTYRQWLRLLFAKGYKLEAIEDDVRGLGFKRGFSRTSLSNKGKTDELVPPKLVEYAWTTKLEGPQEDFETYARHLASVGVEIPAELADKLGTPPPPRIDPQEIAEGLTPKLEALLSPVSERLDSALSALADKLDAVAASLRGKMDAFALATESKLDSFDAKLGRIQAMADEHGRELSSARLKLAMVDGTGASTKQTVEGVKTTVNDTHAKVDVSAAKLDGNRRELRKLMALGALTALAAVSSCVASVSQRLTVPGLIEETSRRRETASSAEPQSLGVLASGTGQMGEKAPPEKWIPKQPFPWQRLAPDCDPAAGEVAINGGCWFASLDVKPPCGPVLFRHGNICYRPVHADPQKPVGATP